MATMSVRATYALDQPTADTIRKLAGRWNISQAEVIRRAVKLAAEQAQAEPRRMTPMDVIEYYRNNPLPRTAAQDKALIARMRKERHEDSEATSERTDRAFAQRAKAK
jgi:Arc/MetJ-type ribon-helix-helix transcriptional regulator